MPKCINLDAHEAKAAADGRLRVILRPVTLVDFRPSDDELFEWMYRDRQIRRGFPRQMWNYLKSGELSCPYGSPGDVVVLREAWRVGAWRDDGRMAIDYKVSPELVRSPWVRPSSKNFARLTQQSLIDCVKAYEAGIGSCRARNEFDYCEGFEWKHGDSPCRWRSPATMPATITRFRPTIERVELVRCISLSDLTGSVVTNFCGEWTFNGGLHLSRTAASAAFAWWTNRWRKKHPWETSWAWKLTLDWKRGEG